MQRNYHHRSQGLVRFVGVLVALALVIMPGLARPAVIEATPAGCQERVLNRGFESGAAAPWVASRSGLVSDLYAHNGRWAALLGSRNEANDDLYQQVVIPSNIITAELSFWWSIQTFEEVHPNDFLTVTIRNTANNTLAVLQTFSDADGSTELPVWTRSVYTLTAYAGQTVRIAFHANTDLTNLTLFFVDDVSLTACGASLTAVRRFLPLVKR
ncbi:MAG: choice-of-anchor J domain-containing protein [Anaerolineae bacterium]|nr:choice-of-anchor J domain-containing protein [Anaerolineae bacterium]